MRIRDRIFIAAFWTTVITAALFIFWLFVRTDEALNALACIDLILCAFSITLVFAMWEDCM